MPVMHIVFDAETNLVLYGDPTDRLVNASHERGSPSNPGTVYATQGRYSEWLHVEERWVDAHRWAGNKVIEVYVR